MFLPIVNHLEQGFRTFFLSFTPCQLPTIKFIPYFLFTRSAVEKKSIVTSASLTLPQDR